MVVINKNAAYKLLVELEELEEHKISERSIIYTALKRRV
jgi:hypothetical protein